MSDDPGVSEMCLALVTYCRDTRTTQEVMAKALTLSPKVDQSIAGGLLQRIMGAGWIAYSDANASEVRITTKGSRWLAEAGA